MICAFQRQFVVSIWLRAGIVLALVLGSAIAGQCAADSTTPGPQARAISEMSIEDLMNITVVTSGKKAESTSKTAAAVFVITHEDIEHYGYRTLAQALKRISGFYSEYDYAYDKIGVRGYLPNSDLNRRVLVLIDGHKVNDYLYGQAPVNQDLPVDMRDIERIEVVKGPGSALWGSEALLCVINCITKTATQVDGLQIRQDYGFNNGQRLSYGGAYPGGLQITGSVQDMMSDGQAKIYFPDFNDPANNDRSLNGGIANGMDGERVGRGFVNMSYKGYKLSYDHVSRVKDLPTAAWSAVFNLPGLNLGDEREYTELSFENPKPLANNGDLFCRVYQDNYDAVGNFNWWENGGIVRDKGFDRSRSYGAEMRYSRDLGSRLSLTFGSEYVRNYVGHRANYITSPNPRLRWERQGDFDMLSHYSQAEWDLTNSLRLVAGTRYDDHSIFGGNWSPRLAAIYKASDRTTFKMLYGEALRIPSLDEYIMSGNPSKMKPEKIVTNEFVWDQQLSNTGHLVTSIYGLRMYDLINQMADAVKSAGIETQYEFRLQNGSSGYLGVAVLDASAFPNGRLVSSPHCLITTGLSLPLFQGQAYLSPQMQFVGASKTNMWNTSPSYAVANLGLSSTSLFKNLDLSLNVTNLFNTPYVVNAEGDQYQDVNPQPGRSLQFQMSYNL